MHESKKSCLQHCLYQFSHPGCSIGQYFRRKIWGWCDLLRVLVDWQHRREDLYWLSSRTPCILHAWTLGLSWSDFKRSIEPRVWNGTDPGRGWWRQLCWLEVRAGNTSPGPGHLRGAARGAGRCADMSVLLNYVQNWEYLYCKKVFLSTFSL